MDTSRHLFYSVGLLFLAILVVSNSSPGQARLNQFEDIDHRTRIKRNATPDNTSGGNETGSSPGVTDDAANQTTAAGSTVNVTPKTSVCFNNGSVSTKQNDTARSSFTCPLVGQNSNMNQCCGPKFQQRCCDGASKDDGDDDDGEAAGMHIDQMDIVTGISIAVGFVLSISFCMFLYCCCCQRRPEIHDGIKLMWVRRSFGKELNRLEQPTYPNHLAVVRSRAGSRFSSRQGSRQTSRAGSRQGSFKGSRNPSVNPSPSISRRASHDQRSSIKASHSPRPNLKVDVPSGVLITVTTPSDEHGPTQPLLKAVDSADLQEI